MGDIDKLFDDYDQRKALERETQTQQEAVKEDLRQHSAATIETIIVPVLETLALSIRQRGHEFNFAQHEEEHGWIRVNVNFEPLTNRPAMSTFPSTLHISVRGLHIGLNEDIRGKDGNSRSGTMIGSSTQHVTNEWIRMQVLAFIGRVLKEN